MEHLLVEAGSRFDAPPLLVIDYAQLLMQEAEVAERTSATLLSKSIAAMAGRTDAAVVAISSVGRASYNVMHRGKPDLDRVLGMAKESGQFEYDAVAVLALVAVQEEEPGRYKRLWAVIGKGRFGCPGRMVPLEYDGLTGRWREISPEDMPTGGAEPKASPERLREQIRDLIGRREGELPSANSVAKRLKGKRGRILAMVKAMLNVGELAGGGKRNPFRLTDRIDPALVLVKFQEGCPDE